eukprot:5931770-Karenia_brevis.AAC.1
MLSEIGVPSARLFCTHDFQRGHADDFRRSGAPLWVILEAGGWRSPAFLKYISLHMLDRDLVIQAHMGEESDSEADD